MVSEGLFICFVSSFGLQALLLFYVFKVTGCSFIVGDVLPDFIFLFRHLLCYCLEPYVPLFNGKADELF